MVKIRAGKYTGTLVEIREVLKPNRLKCIQFIFTIETPKGIVDINGETSNKFTEKSRLANWLLTLGIPINVKEYFNVNKLPNPKNKTVMLIVRTRIIETDVNIFKESYVKNIYPLDYVFPLTKTKWFAHLAQVRKENPRMKATLVCKLAKESYVKN